MTTKVSFKHIYNLMIFLQTMEIYNESHEKDISLDKLVNKTRWKQSHVRVILNFGNENTVTKKTFFFSKGLL